LSYIVLYIYTCNLQSNVNGIYTTHILCVSYTILSCIALCILDWMSMRVACRDMCVMQHSVLCIYAIYNMHGIFYEIYRAVPIACSHYHYSGICAIHACHIQYHHALHCVSIRVAYRQILDGICSIHISSYVRYVLSRSCDMYGTYCICPTHV